MSTQLLWFATRGAGVVSLLLLTAVVCLGLLTAAGWRARGWPRFLTVEVHRSLALLSVVFVVVHVLTAIFDPFTHLGITAAIVPFASAYRPLWVGLGVLAMDLGLAVLVTSLVRDRLPHAAWRAVHWLPYGAWPLAVAHTIGAGSDAGATWMLAIDVLCIGAVALALLWRLGSVGTSRGSEDALMGIVGDGGQAPR